MPPGPSCVPQMISGPHPSNCCSSPNDVNSASNSTLNPLPPLHPHDCSLNPAPCCFSTLLAPCIRNSANPACGLFLYCSWVRISVTFFKGYKKFFKKQRRICNRHLCCLQRLNYFLRALHRKFANASLSSVLHTTTLQRGLSKIRKISIISLPILRPVSIAWYRRLRGPAWLSSTALLAPSISPTHALFQDLCHSQRRLLHPLKPFTRAVPAFQVPHHPSFCLSGSEHTLASSLSKPILLSTQGRFRFELADTFPVPLSLVSVFTSSFNLLLTSDQRNSFPVRSF